MTRSNIAQVIGAIQALTLCSFAATEFEPEQSVEPVKENKISGIWAPGDCMIDGHEFRLKNAEGNRYNYDTKEDMATAFVDMADDLGISPGTRIKEILYRITYAAKPGSCCFEIHEIFKLCIILEDEQAFTVVFHYNWHPDPDKCLKRLCQNISWLCGFVKNGFVHFQLNMIPDTTAECWAEWTHWKVGDLTDGTWASTCYIILAKVFALQPKIQNYEAYACEGSRCPSSWSNCWKFGDMLIKAFNTGKINKSDREFEGACNARGAFSRCSVPRHYVARSSCHQTARIDIASESPSNPPGEKPLSVLEALQMMH